MVFPCSLDLSNSFVYYVINCIDLIELRGIRHGFWVYLSLHFQLLSQEKVDIDSHRELTTKSLPDWGRLIKLTVF